MKHPNQDEIVYGIVTGGDSEDPAPDKAGGFRVHLPFHYGSNIDTSKLPFVRMLTEATENGVNKFNPPPERGTAVMAVKHGASYPGTGHMTVLGVLPNDIAKNMGVPGGKSLVNLFQDAISHVTNKKAPPKSLKNDQRDGAQIRQVQDSNMWSHSLVKSIPSTATAWPMSGMPLPAVQGVHTAIQHFTSILTGSMLSGLPGSLMSLGSMFTKLQSSGALSQITSGMDPDLVDAMNSIANLIPAMEISESAMFATSGRVDEDTFMANAMDLLAQARNVGDIIDVLHRLQNDTSLHGTDKLGTITVTSNTAFGSVDIIISVDGTARSNINVANLLAMSANTANTANANTTSSSSGSGGNSTAQNILNFISMMTSASQAFAMSGENLFGESAKQKFDMYNRMNPDALSTAKSLIETLNTGDKEASGHRLVATLVRDGGKLLSGKGFKV